MNSKSQPITHDYLWQALAPGRVNLIGEHTDYNDGFTLPLAIERYTTVSARPLDSGSKTSCYTSLDLGQSACWTAGGESFVANPSVSPGESATNEAPAWSKYVAGVVNQFTRLGYTVPPLELQIETTVPLGGGVSSSASLEVAVAMVLQKVLDIKLDGLEIAKLCQAAEHQYAGVPCGLMDQLSSVFGRTNHLLLMDCRSNDIEFIPAAPEVAFIVVNSRIKHSLADGEYRKRRQQCEEACRLMQVDSLRDVDSALLKRSRSTLSDVVYRRVRHVVSENLRTVAAAEHLKSGEWNSVGELMYESHLSMRDDYEITCTEIDLLVSIAQQIGMAGGVYGARMTGGGFGGCIVVLARVESADAIRHAIESKYHEQTGIKGDSFVTRPAAGALELFRQ